MKFTISFISFLLIFISGNSQSNRDTDYFVKNLKKVTDVMVYDVTSPVASARYYAYTCLAAHEGLVTIGATTKPSLLKTVSNADSVYLPTLQIPNSLNGHFTILNVLKTAQLLLPSGSKLSESITQVEGEIPQDFRKLCSEGSNFISQRIRDWAIKDGFLQLNNLRRYTPQRGKEYWQPTAPAFMQPVEPHWHTVRTFFIDSAQQFRPPLPNSYNEDTSSPFMKEVNEVYDLSRKLTKEQIHIANFWDCNPYMIQQIGHVEFGVKKISPGGHWMGIAGIATKKKKMSLDETVFIHAVLAMSLHDAFIACWDEKYHSNRIRPETVINRLIDKKWRPLLQTPPFPEYVSGHSVASTVSGHILTKLIGYNFSFTDDTEVEFGIKKRKFKSFNKAAEEASISRLYGGIHYRDGIVNGIWQGEKVAHHIIEKLNSILSLHKN